MAIDETIRAVRCGGLRSELERARSKFNEQTARLSILQQKIQMEENQLRNLREQANRTGDREGFALDIIHVEEQIRSLQQDIVRAENEQRDARNNVNQLTRQVANFSC